MSHIIINKWKKLQSEIKQKGNDLERQDLISYLINWTQEIKLIEDPSIQKKFSAYLSYFEKFSIESKPLPVKPWYSLQEIIEYDIIKSTTLTFDRPIVIVRDILWELLAFKSNIECSCCREDNLRVLTTHTKENLFFSCDMCGCTFNEDEEKVRINTTLYPADYVSIINKNIQSSSI